MNINASQSENSLTESENVSSLKSIRVVLQEEYGYSEKTWNRDVYFKTHGTEN